MMTMIDDQPDTTLSIQAGERIEDSLASSYGCVELRLDCRP